MLLIGVFVYSSLGLWTAHSSAQRPRSVLYRRCEFYNQTRRETTSYGVFLIPRHRHAHACRLSREPESGPTTQSPAPLRGLRGQSAEAVASGVSPLFLKLAASHGNH